MYCNGCGFFNHVYACGKGQMQPLHAILLAILPSYSAFPDACMQGTSPTLLVTWWRLAYWYGFAVQFTVLPFHQEYADSGHFTVSDRISTAIRNNLIFYAVLVVSILHLLQLVSLAIPTRYGSAHHRLHGQ